MLCEIEFLPVGTGSRPGDAIIVRYGDLQNYEIMLVDGGTADTGNLVVSHLKKYFGPDVSIAHMVLTHSDADHASGLRAVLRELPVKNVWMHVPWAHASEARHLFEHKGWTDKSLEAAIKKEYDIVSEIVDLALAANTPVYFPFEGAGIGPFRVLSPQRHVYVHLLPQFDKTPNPDETAIRGANMWLGKQPNMLAKLIDALVAKAQTWVTEDWYSERLKDGGVTSASNETSVVLYGDFGNGQRILLTGDAGIEALTWAAAHAERWQLPLKQFGFVQVPYHGSRRNVGPTILNRLIGPIQAHTLPHRFVAFISAPPEDDTHPRKMVVNAFLRRGANVIATQGYSKIHYGGFARRADYGDAVPMTFSEQVEDYD
jgi:beta-lactamase superfamily II metal-dependent hydrolase